MLIIQGCFSCCWEVFTQCQGLLSLSSHPPARSPGHSWEGTQAGRADPNCPEGYPTIWGHVQCNNQGKKSAKGCTWLGISQWMVSNCIGHLLFCIFGYYYYYYYYCFNSCPIKLSLSQPTNFTFFPNSFPCPTGRGSELEAGWCLGSCLVKPQQSIQNTKCINCSRRVIWEDTLVMLLWDQWTVSILINKNPSKFAHFYFRQTYDFTLFYGIINKAHKQDFFLWSFIPLCIWIFVCWQLSGDLKLGLMEKARL